MNWQRGLFRLWIVGSVLFVIAVAVISYTSIKTEFDAPSSTIASKPNTQIIEFEDRLYQFPADATDKEIAAALKTNPVDYLIPMPNPWKSIGVVAAIAFGIPLVVLVLGSSLVWAFSGFAAKRT